MRRHKTWPVVVWLVVAGLLVLIGFVGASASSDSRGENVLFDYDLALGGVFFYGLMVLVSYLIARAYPRPPDALGLRRFRLRWVWIALAVAVATTIFAVAVEPFLHGGEDQGLGADRWEPDKAGAFAANVLILVLLGPFAEELFFRGIGVRVLVRYGGLLAILATGVIFGLVHGILGALPPLVFFGIGLAWVRLRSASVWPAFVGHAVYNGFGVLALVISWAV